MTTPKPSGLRNPARAVRSVGAATLVVEAVVLLLALLPLVRLGGAHKSAAAWLCGGLAVLAIVFAGMLRRPWAWWAGAVIPVALFGAGFWLHWSLSVLGVLYGLVWAYVLYVRQSILSTTPTGAAPTE
jgi:hypothetical protein